MPRPALSPEQKRVQVCTTISPEMHKLLRENRLNASECLAYGIRAKLEMADPVKSVKEYEAKIDRISKKLMEMTEWKWRAEEKMAELGEKLD